MDNIVEAYPKDKYLPSYLIYAMHNDEIFHIQIAIDKKDDTIVLVTSYKPNVG